MEVAVFLLVLLAALFVLFLILAFVDSLYEWWRKRRQRRKFETDMNKWRIKTGDPNP